MTVVVKFGARGPSTEIRCDWSGCGREVLGLHRCWCGYSEHQFCEDHRCPTCEERSFLGRVNGDRRA